MLPANPPPIPAASQDARLEVEQTLRVAGDETELRIATYRVLILTCVIALTVALHVLIDSPDWAPTGFWLAALAFAVMLWQFVRRRGARDGAIYLSLLLDLFWSASVYAFIVRTRPELTRQATEFADFTLAPGLVLVLSINALRGHRRAAILGGLAAPLAFVTVMRVLHLPKPAELPVVMILLLAGLVGIAAGRQQQRNMQRVARLLLLRRYLQPAAVERVLKDDPDASMALGGQLVTRTLLSSDLRGYTAMSERLSPSETVAQLNAYHGAMLGVMERHGGVLDKFIGDGALMVFGVDDRADHGAADAVACAREMIAALALHNDDRNRRGLLPLQMGIGVHTGPVIAGNIGAGGRVEYTVIGDAVNTAARLEGLTKEVGSAVLISHECVSHLIDAQGLVELPPKTLRGKTTEQRLFTFAPTGKAT